jgi:hypothetical protein
MILTKAQPAKKPPAVVRPKLDGYWIGWLNRQFSDHPEVNPGRVSELAQTVARELGRNDAPARATTYKYFDFYQRIPERLRSRYQEFVWPEVMEAGILPWEASRVVLDLLAWAAGHQLPPLTVGIVEWFWRISLALPEAPLHLRLRVALTCATYWEADERIPENLRTQITLQTVPEDYRPQIKTGGASVAWAIEVGVLNNASKKVLYGLPPEEQEHVVG